MQYSSEVASRQSCSNSNHELLSRDTLLEQIDAMLNILQAGAHDAGIWLGFQSPLRQSLWYICSPDPLPNASIGILDKTGRMD